MAIENTVSNDICFDSSIATYPVSALPGHTHMAF